MTGRGKADIAEAPAIKPYDVAYTVKTMQEITDMQTKETKKIAALLEVPVRYPPPVAWLR
jgi:hypothetical protein